MSICRIINFNVIHWKVIENIRKYYDSIIHVIIKGKKKFVKKIKLFNFDRIIEFYIRRHPGWLSLPEYDTPFFRMGFTPV